MTVLRLTMSHSAQTLYKRIEAVKAAERIVREGRATEQDLDALEGLARRADGSLTRRAHSIAREVAYAIEKQAPDYRGIDIIV